MNEASSIYGPVQSWRVGRSLGVDLLLVDSICSFRCLYCQLGRINRHTLERRVYVPTHKVLRDLAGGAWREADVVTFSGSGEPTLAANLGEALRAVKRRTGRPALVLTNATTLNDIAVRRDLAAADLVFCKLDAADEEGFRRVNRPVPGLTLASIVEGIRRFRSEYRGRLAVQTMLLPLNAARIEEWARLLREIGPDEVQLNTPSRPVPSRWTIAARGNHRSDLPGGRRLKPLAAAAAARFATDLGRLTGLPILSAFNRSTS